MWAGENRDLVMVQVMWTGSDGHHFLPVGPPGQSEGLPLPGLHSISFSAPPRAHVCKVVQRSGVSSAQGSSPRCGQILEPSTR